MVTQLLQAATFDVLSAAKEQRALPSHYPAVLANYVKSANEDTLFKDAQAVLTILGSGTSVISEAWRLTQANNTFFTAFVASLNEVRTYESNETSLGRMLASFREAGATYGRVLTREMQSLLAASGGGDSPIIQIATPAEIDTSHLPGIPEITVQRSLLGGARMFHKGTLTDNSWRARLLKILSA